MVLAVRHRNSGESFLLRFAHGAIGLVLGLAFLSRAHAAEIEQQIRDNEDSAA